ncbi:uncharacterized protein LOC128266854 [Anopheles cruzii]|uniref:uncharacterized protein LOC128266854 n=1 Tax=Anopheles cruzii TaxID=68878 RepID=UPI0022EC81EB|nr:uncharacterized protein LOC128266854 [Anopheles cruzii]
MHVTSNVSTATTTSVVVGEKRPGCEQKDAGQDTRKVSSFIQRFYFFGNRSAPEEIAKAGSQEIKTEKTRSTELSIGVPRSSKNWRGGAGVDQSQSSSDSSPDSPAPYPAYSVQRLRQFWNNRLLAGSTASGATVDTLTRKAKSATIGAPVASRAIHRKSPSPRASYRSFQRNGSIGRSGKRHSLLTAVADPQLSVESVAGHKRSSQTAVLSPDRSTPVIVEKRQCVGATATGATGGTVRRSFPLATATPAGNHIHWARRTELLGIRALTREEQEPQRDKMPLRVENYVNNFIDVDIQSVTTGAVEDEVPPVAAVAMATEEPSPVPVTLQPSASPTRKGNTPTRKISFLNNGSPYRRRLMAGNGTKVAALTSKFNQMIQQDARLLEEVKKRGGYIHRAGNVAYKVLEDTRSLGASGALAADGYGSLSARNTSGRSSLRKKSSSASNADADSSDEVASGSSKSSSLRRTGVRKRPSLRKNMYRRPDWAETGRSSLGVRKVLEMFEPHRNSTKTDATSHGDTGKPPPGRGKPKVPDKSEQVLLLATTKEQSKRVQAQEGESAEPSATTEEPPEGSTDPMPLEGEMMDATDGQAAEEPSRSSAPTQEPIEEVITLPSTPPSDVGPPIAEVKEKKKSKSTVSKIYERLTFRSSRKIQIEPTVPDTEGDSVPPALRDSPEPAPKEARRSFVSSIEIPTIVIEENPVPEVADDASEQKILEAISRASQRIENLSKSFNDLSLANGAPAPVAQEVKVKEESGLQVRPNASFLFGSAHASQRNIAEAVNTVVINKSVSMDDHQFPCFRGTTGRQSLNERTLTQRGHPENDYELVTQPDDSGGTVGSASISSPSIDLVELTTKIESFIHKSKRDSDNLYQCIARIGADRGPDDTVSVNSYESFENYESIEHGAPDGCTQAARDEDTYEICSPPPPPPPPARDDPPPVAVGGSNDLTLPQPKRNLSASPKTLPKHLQVTYQSNYERIKYSKIPPRPPKPDDIPLPPRNNPSVGAPTPCTTPVGVGDPTKSFPVPECASEVPSGDLLDKSPHGHIYEENIYDTIRSADDGLDYDDPASIAGADSSGEPEGSLSEGVPPSSAGRSTRPQQQQQQHHQQQRPQQQSPTGDNVSLVSSNCYESIGSRIEYVRQLALHHQRIGGSTTTLASDQITNSLYGTTGGLLPSLTPPSERGSDTSNNSAEWTDISDDDYGTVTTPGGLLVPPAGSKRPNFIVVRERKRTHHTPLRSRKVARISHTKIDDDSDHHYESLYSIGSNDYYPHHRPDGERLRVTGTDGVTSGHQVNFHEHRGVPTAAGSPQDPAALLSNDDEFDSFDSDDSDDGDDESHRNRTDSGVDIRNAKLPDPPASASQVYVLVQKIKSLGSTLSKSEIAKGFNKFSKRKQQPPPPAKATGVATYENAILPPKPSSKVAKAKASAFKLPLPLGGTAAAPKPPPEDYVNSEFAVAGGGGRHTHSHSCSSLLPSPSAPSSPSSGLPAAPPSSGGADLLLRSTSESSNVSTVPTVASGGDGGAPVQTPSRTKKPKSSKSLRSKLRKSLVSDGSTNLNIGSSFNGSRSTFYVTTSATVGGGASGADVDSGIFNGLEASSTGPLLSASCEDSRRRSIASVAGAGGGPTNRPTIPPPPPPLSPVASPTIEGTHKSCVPHPATGPKFPSRKLGATSWYAECGVFLQSPSPPLKDGPTVPPMLVSPTATTNGSSSASWYAEIYQTSGASVASSSESSGVSTGGEGGPGDDHSHSMFVNEPLYQIYNAAKLESITRDIDAEINGQAELYDDGYEKISDRGREGADRDDDGGGGVGSGGSSGDGSTDGSEFSAHNGRHHRHHHHPSLRKPSRPTALELIEPHVGKLRTLWCEIPEVRNSEILATLTPTEKRLQEAKFEILTSEASYLKSLNLLRTHFVNHPAFRDVRILSSAERKTLFSSIIPVQECSDRLLCDLENCWQDNIMLLGLSHSIYKHAEKQFHVYVTYCEHQAKIDRTLKALKANKPEFAKTLAELESDSVCCSLSLSSFLMLPMQRITRMRLLLDAVLQRCRTDDDEFGSWEKTFVLINRILTRCNDAAHRSEQVHEMELLSRQIEFPTHIRPLPIVPCGIGAAPSSMHRKLEKRGELVHLLWRGDDAKLTFGKKFSKSNVYAFLFTDLLVLTKKKSDESYLVVDYCQRALLAVSSGDVVPGLPAKEMQTLGKNLIIMTLLENHEGKTIEMIVSCPSETERERWLTVAEPPASENPEEKIYEQWDCPQVIAVHPYQALQPDELDLDIKDVVHVHRKMADGWYEGERIRDGAVGWFPSNYTKEIPSPHIRAKHIKQRHMLLTYTSKYIDTASKGHHQPQHHHQYNHYQQHHHHHQHQGQSKK